MANQLWKVSDGIKFTDEPWKPDKPYKPNTTNKSNQPINELGKEKSSAELVAKSKEPEKPNETLLADAIPATNGIWDSQNGNDVDKVALHGFTIAELVDLGALATTNDEKNILPNNLEGDIHPAFSIDKWETCVPAHFKRKNTFPLGPHPNGLPRLGNYTANNLLVWKALLPSLRLASKFVQNAHMFPWYTALLHSEIYPVTSITHDAKQLYRPLRKLHFLRQSDIANPAIEKASFERIAEISKHIRLGISDGNSDPTGANPELKVKYDGVAIPPWVDANNHYRIYLAYQIIEPLLDDEVGPSTKLALQFHVALTLLHEFAHVLMFAKRGARDFKLYLDNERISEAGFSFEANTFGGHPVLLLQHGNSPDYNGPIRAGFLLEDWLGTAKGHQWIEPLSGTETDWNNREWREVRSIPISFLEELGQEDFWRCFVSRWGSEALKVYPCTEGRLVKKSGNVLRTQIYSTSERNRAWLKAAQQVSQNSSDSLMPDEIIAVRIANRRISREKEINALVKTRRNLEEQKMRGPSGRTSSSEPRLEDDRPDDLMTGDDPLTVASGQPGDIKPWQRRAENIAAMKKLLDQQIYMCSEEDERVGSFIKREDTGTPDYVTTQTALMATNAEECKSFRKLVQNAFNDDLLEGYEMILQRYEAMKDNLGRISRQTSEDREIECIEESTNNQCVVLLRRARACRDRGEHKRCCDHCIKILSKDNVALYLRAGAFLICGLSTADLEWKVWYLSEAVRVYKLMEHFEGKDPSEPTVTKRQHAEERLAEAKVELAASNTAAPKSALLGPQIIKPTQPSSPPKTPPNPKVPRPAYIIPRKKPRRSFTGFANLPSNTPTPSAKYDPAPEGMPPTEVIKHRRTFKVINQARRNFFLGDYDLAERGFLELLNLQGTSEWQKARCHAFLASIHTRNDRAERVRTALNIYRGFLKKWPEDQRCIVVVREAEELEKRVLAEIEQESVAASNQEAGEENVTMNGALGIRQTGKGHVRVGSGKIGAGLDAIAEDDVDYEHEGEREVELRSHRKEEKSRLVAGVVEKVATFFGLKRRREDDYGESEGRRARRTRFT